jgi:endonuclease/exonuclease/phosphatase family metal-dependent hydrolase
LLSWNASDFVNTQLSTDTTGNPRRTMLSFIKETDADVICLQDFSNKKGKGFFNVFHYIKDTLGYHYTYFPLSYTFYLTELEQEYGNTIFSKYPITDSGKTALPFSGPDEFLSYIDVKIKEKTVRFYTAHLLSLSLHTSSNRPEQINFINRDSSLILHKSTLKKLSHFDKIHAQQAIAIKQVLDATQLPYVFCADLNSVPSTYTYHHLKSGLQDAFLQNDFGIGRTYDSISPTLRIDVVLLNNQLKAVQHKTPVLHLSDHYPNITDFQFR